MNCSKNDLMDTKGVLDVDLTVFRLIFWSFFNSLYYDSKT